MRTTFAPRRTLPMLLLVPALTIFAPAGFGQSTAIEPCPATTTQTKPSFKAQSPSTTRNNTRAAETVIDSSIPGDAAVEKMLTPYSEKVKALSVVIGRLETELKKSVVGAGSVGNFVTDAMKAQAKAKLGKSVVLALMNSGGMRKNEITPGDLRASDIFELLPFENALVAIDLTGVQLVKVLQVAIRDAQSGARIQFRWNEQNRTELIGAKLVDENGREREIDGQATYTIVTIDYLQQLGSGSFKILQEGKNVKSLDVTLRDAVMDYVKSETAARRPIRVRLDNRYVQVGPGPTQSEVPN